MSTVGFIFARGGSKGVPGKNIRSLGGKPLIAWSIEQALAVGRIERVLVSTDSLEIADVARAYGAEVPFMRPPHLARDDSPEWLAWRHALEYLRNQEGVLPKTMVSIPTTAPLRLPIDLENCLDEYEKGIADAVVTVTDAHRSPYFNMVTRQADNRINLVMPPAVSISRRQDTPIVYDMTTVAYVLNAHFVLQHAGLFEGRVHAVHVPVERALDIDTMLDFRMADMLIAERTAGNASGARKGEVI
ncbi:acylneuraminate cytidylyltransferase family protein [Polynucleobacter sp. MG-Unter2-18]|uniref:acylneuraminate cytidylyltransferase family protein n=1 Tax=Polynucleobacter sp. MG-Unter2-18 TaxID=2081052 RepID=UPI001BFDEE0E|nr:acylneuraminate cytidylyltransferase family protein [Polynucleobacter sp. MG-Unter2-18]QWD94860.1 acylneuraminate cytidylyltransferase family protein [Polynucleobacter sp. MG-Unter2-18]